jgi:hypothetical protein
MAADGGAALPSRSDGTVVEHEDKNAASSIDPLVADKTFAHFMKTPHQERFVPRM